jgi:CMP-N-acetylneuraminic acid synthetase
MTNAEKNPITTMLLYIVNTAQSCSTIRAIFVDSARMSVLNVPPADRGFPREAMNP